MVRLQDRAVGAVGMISIARIPSPVIKLSVPRETITVAVRSANCGCMHADRGRGFPASLDKQYFSCQLHGSKQFGFIGVLVIDSIQRDLLEQA